MNFPTRIFECFYPLCKSAWIERRKNEGINVDNCNESLEWITFMLTQNNEIDVKLRVFGSFIAFFSQMQLKLEFLKQAHSQEGEGSLCP